jgi:hypothetical protein
MATQPATCARSLRIADNLRCGEEDSGHHGEEARWMTDPPGRSVTAALERCHTATTCGTG